MEPVAVLGFAAIAAALIVVPGPDWAHVLAAGARDRVVLPAVSGLLIGYALITVVVAVGVGPLVDGRPSALLLLTVAGAAYLIYLGVRTLRSSGSVDTRDADAPYRSAAAPSAPLGRYVVRGSV